MDPTKAKSRGISCDMSPAAVEARLEAVDELRELAVALSSAQRLGQVEVQANAADLAAETCGLTFVTAPHDEVRCESDSEA